MRTSNPFLVQIVHDLNVRNLIIRSRSEIAEREEADELLNATEIPVRTRNQGRRFPLIISRTGSSPVLLLTKDEVRDEI